MFRDASEELARLEAELLAEEDPTPEEELTDEDLDMEDLDDGDFPEEDLPDDDPLGDTRVFGDPAFYQNYSNDYGKDLRNYASGYRAYNTDVTDEDLDSYSEEVRQGRRSGGTALLVILILLLTLGILAAVVLLLRYRGLL